MTHVLREQIVSEARSWIGTRFQHQGRVKATALHVGGCDCIGLLLGVASAVDLKDKNGKPIIRHDRRDYGRIPDGVNFKQRLSSALTEITFEQVEPGDVMLFRFDGNPQHVAIATQYIYGGHGIIHCYAEAKEVVETRLDDEWIKKYESSYLTVY